MKGGFTVAVLASLLVVSLAPPAAAEATAAAGVGRGQAAFTFCIEANHYEFSFAATREGGTWEVQATLISMHFQCFPPPFPAFTGTWDPAAGGCGLGNAEYTLCFDPAPAPAGEVGWRLCPARDPVCDQDHTLYYGTVLMAWA